MGKTPSTYNYKRRYKVGATPMLSIGKTILGRRGIPDVLATKLVYTGLYINNDAGDTYLIMRADSLYDPQYSLGGGQPSYFDQLALLYNHYVVDASRIEVDVMRTPLSESKNCQGSIGLIPTNDPAYTSNPMEASEKTYGKMAVVNTEVKNTHIQHYMTKSKIYGSKYDAYVAKAGVAADPTYMPFYWVISFSPAAVGTAFMCTMIIKMTFYARFFNRKNPDDV